VEPYRWTTFMAFFRPPYDSTTLDLLEECGRNVQRVAILLRELLVDYPEHADLASEVRLAEQEGDRITHDIIHRLNGSGGGRAPFDAREGYELATALDDIVDHAEHAADCLGLYGVEAPMEQAVSMADVLVHSAAEVSRALCALRSGNELGPSLVEIHRLENEADRISREAIASLFVNGVDPMVVIRWKDIFETLEASVDACETVAHVLEGITLKLA
jgi:predicted phosphate transport protein (TIGR00153 family)